MSAKTRTLVLQHTEDQCSNVLTPVGRGRRSLTRVTDPVWGDDEIKLGSGMGFVDMEICDQWFRKFFPGRVPSETTPFKAYRVTIEEVSLDEAGIIVEDNRGD